MNKLSRASRGRTVALAALVGSVLTVMPAPLAMHAIAAADSTATYLDVEADTATVDPGSTVELTATVYDQYGERFMEAGSRVKMWWLDGPNGPDSPGGSSDLACTTDADGRCTVSYVATSDGTDLICASIGGSKNQCTEPWNDPERDDARDTVRRVVSSTPEPSPTPTPTPEPTPTPTPDPTPTPTPTPNPTPTPTPNPTPTPTPTPNPTPTPTPTPNPTPTPTPTPNPTPTPTPTPNPTPTPTPTPNPTPTPDPTPTPTPDPTPTPTPDPTPTPTPDPSPTPGPTPDPSPEPSPTPIAVPRPTPLVGEGSAGGPATPVQGGPHNRTGGLLPGQPTGRGPTDLGGVLDYVADAAVDQAALIVKPAAAVAVASSFVFPLILMLAVIFFLVVQPRMDGRDPKLRNAPRTASETLVQFEDEGAS